MPRLIGMGEADNRGQPMKINLMGLKANASDILNSLWIVALLAVCVLIMVLAVRDALDDLFMSEFQRRNEAIQECLQSEEFTTEQCILIVSGMED